MSERARAPAAAGGRAEHEPRILSIPGVHGLGEGRAQDHGGEEGPCYVVFAERGVPANAVPAELEGLPVFIVRGSAPTLH